VPPTPLRFVGAGMLRSLRAYKNRDENIKSCQLPPVDLATFTNTNHRAVSTNSPHRFDNQLNSQDNDQTNVTVSQDKNCTLTYVQSRE